MSEENNNTEPVAMVQGRPLTEMGMLVGALVNRLGSEVVVSKEELTAVTGIAITQIGDGRFRVEVS